MSLSLWWVTFCYRRGMLKFTKLVALVMLPSFVAACSAMCARVDLDMEEISLSVVFEVRLIGLSILLGICVCFIVDGGVIGVWLVEALVALMR